MLIVRRMGLRSELPSTFLPSFPPFLLPAPPPLPSLKNGKPTDVPFFSLRATTAVSTGPASQPWEKTAPSRARRGFRSGRARWLGRRRRRRWRLRWGGRGVCTLVRGGFGCFEGLFFSSFCVSPSYGFCLGCRCCCEEGKQEVYGLFLLSFGLDPTASLFWSRVSDVKWRPENEKARQLVSVFSVGGGLWVKVLG